MTVIEGLRATIINGLNAHLPESEVLAPIGEDNVLIDFPDTDRMPKSTMFYIQPNWADFENLTTESDSSIFSVAVFILCKRDKSENLTKKIYGYFNALYSLLRRNTSLDGVVDFTEVTNSEFYPAVEANRSIQGVEVSVSLRYTKDF